MANPERGDVDLVVGEKTYTLRMRTNAICELQERTGKAYGELLNDVIQRDYKSIRALLFTFLQPHHAKEFKTVESVGDLMDELGGHSGVLPSFTALWTRNQPPKSSGGVSGNPPQAQVGTGGNSTETVAESA